MSSELMKTEGISGGNSGLHEDKVDKNIHTTSINTHIQDVNIQSYANVPIYPFYRPPFDENNVSPGSSGT